MLIMASGVDGLGTCEVSTVTEAARAEHTAKHAGRSCLACGAVLHGPWCHVCGQKDDDCRRSVLRLVAEGVTDIAALDGRFFRTCRNVVVQPGRHVHDYAHGRRSPFTPPVRLFLLVSLLFFTTLQLTNRHLLVLDVELRERGEVAQEVVAEVEARLGGDGALSSEEQDILDRVREAAGNGAGETEMLADAEAEETDGPSNAVTIDSEDGVSLEVEVENGGRWVPIPHVMFLAPAPEREYSPEERAYIREMIGSESFEINGKTVDSEILSERILSILRNPAAFSNALNEWIPRLMLVFVPLMALLGTTVIRGRDALIYDHLLLSLQTHAIGFVVITVSIWCAGFMPGGAAGILFFAGVPIYYMLAAKGAFGRSWRKTVFATLFVFAIYSLLFWTGLVIAATQSFMEIY